MSHSSSTTWSVNGMTSFFPPRSGASSTPRGALPFLPTATPLSSMPLHPGGETPPLQDEITKRRDSEGNRLGNDFAYDTPLVADVPVDETHLAVALNVIAERFPATAAFLRHYHDSILLNMIAEEHRVQREEYEKSRRRNAQAAAANPSTDMALQALRTERERLVAPFREEEQSLIPELSEAHSAAVMACATAGILYKPEEPKAALPELLRHATPMPTSVASANAELPDTETDRAILLPKWASWLCTALVGVLNGTSLGLVGHLFGADDLQDGPWIAIFTAIIGVAGAALGKVSLGFLGQQVGEAYWLRRRWDGRVRILAATAFTYACLVFLIDLLLERAGIMAYVSLELAALQQTPTFIDQLTWLLVGGFVMLGYVLSSLGEGILSGRRQTIKNLVAARQHADDRDAEESRRMDPAVQAAFGAVSNVLEVLARRTELSARVVEAAAPCDAQIARLVAERPTAGTDLGEEAKRRIQDAHDNAQGAQLFFNERLDAALRAVETLDRPQRERSRFGRKGGFLKAAFQRR
jgi:hypothetical protein